MPDLSTSLPSPRPWAVHASLAGVLAVGLGGLLGTARYLALPDALGPSWSDWSRMPLALGLFVLITGISLGLCIGGTTWLAVRRSARLPGLMAAGALGGVLAGIVPGLLGIAGFGSLHAPYAGTSNILGSSLVGAIAFVAVWSPRLFPREDRPWLRHLGHAALASVISLGAFGMIAWSLVRTLDWVPQFATLADLALSIGLIPFAVLGGVLLGASIGAAIGGACGLVGRMGR